MATENLSPALRAPASPRPYPKPHRGYGKRTAPDQRPSAANDFALLPERERYIAGYVDHLPDGALMDIKTLARSIPLYGQMAVASALKALTVAGYLRRAQCRIGEGESRWVTLTYWSRTARDNEWWTTFATGENLRATQEATTAQAAAEAPVTPSGPARRPAPQPAQPAPAPSAPSVPQQRTLEPAPAHAPGGSSHIEPRLALSAANCTALEALAAEWFVRGVDTDYLTHALTSGLPDRVGSPIGLVRRRLRDKIPPHVPTAPAPAPHGAPARRVLVECTECGAPGPSEALPDGLCRRCRVPAPVPGTAPTTPAIPPTERDIHALVGNLRNLLKAP